jgi:hypothetical protein
MFRCVLLAALALCSAAQAQPVRTFPANALRGTLTVTQPPEVLLNGQAARLSPGARIRGPNNLLQMSGSLVGQTLLVNYTVEPLGSVHNVWILSADEAARHPWPTTVEQARHWVFDPAAQTWSKP